MENTLENAIAFYLERKSSTLTPFITKSIAQIMVDYHNSVRPEVVVPSEKEIIKKSFHVWPVTQSSYHERIRVRYRENYRNDFNLFMDRLKELNPTMTFTELNNEK